MHRNTMKEILVLLAAILTAILYGCFNGWLLVHWVAHLAPVATLVAIGAMVIAAKGAEKLTLVAVEKAL